MSHAESPLTVVTEALAAHGMTDRVMELTTDVPTAAAAAPREKPWPWAPSPARGSVEPG